MPPTNPPLTATDATAASLLDAIKTGSSTVNLYAYLDSGTLQAPGFTAAAAQAAFNAHVIENLGFNSVEVALRMCKRGTYVYSTNDSTVVASIIETPQVVMVKQRITVDGYADARTYPRYEIVAPSSLAGKFISPDDTQAFAWKPDFMVRGA